MNIRVIISKTEDIRLTHQHCKDIALHAINKAFDLKGGHYISDKGMLCCDSEGSGGSHSWTDTKVIREATDKDMIGLAAIQAIKEMKD